MPDQCIAIDEAAFGDRVRAQFLRTDGALIFLQYKGLVEQIDAFKAAANNSQRTDWDDQYMRLSMQFGTAMSGIDG